MTLKSNYWRQFRRRKDLEEAIRGLVDSQRNYVEFESPLISDLIADRHYYCSLHGLRPTAFKKTHEDRPYRFYGLFERHGWHPVSWTKSVSPPPTKLEIIGDALRERTREQKIAFRRAHPVCVQCRAAPSVETHHAEPSFEEILRDVFSRVTAEDIDAALKTWDWFKTEQYLIPEGHVLVRLFDERHRAARLVALCQACHNATKRRKATDQM